MSEEVVTGPFISTAERTPGWLYGIMAVSAAAGGWVAVALAVLPGMGASEAMFVMLFVSAPFYEEALKPLGVYFVFLRWPQYTLSRIQIALLGAAGGLAFALVESWLYVDAYPGAGGDFALFRFTAPVAMHVAASFVFGLGLTPALFSWLLRRGELPLLTRQAYVSAVGIHVAYNITVLILATVGIRDFVEQTGA